MPAYNFKQRFAAAVATGKKRQTIRKRRKVRTTVGQTAYLYTGLRTRAVEKLGEGRIWRVREITILGTAVWVGGKLMQGVDLAAFALADGFESLDEFFAFFGSSFEGDVIEWEPRA